jgi:hypothetical protein
LLILPSGPIEAVTATAAVAAAHGIYSMSFLELWSLTQGSYSFTILGIVDTMTVADPERVVRELIETGDQKKVQRHDSLRRLGLITRDAVMLKLTGRGERSGDFWHCCSGPPICRIRMTLNWLAFSIAGFILALGAHAIACRIPLGVTG